MPAKSQAQRKLIFAKRNQYGSIDKTPKKWRWIWEEEWENKGKLPEKVKKNENVLTFEDFSNMNESRTITFFNIKKLNEEFCNVIIKKEDSINDYKNIAKKLNGIYKGKQESAGLFSLSFEFKNKEDLKKFKDQIDYLYPEDVV